MQNNTTPPVSSQHSSSSPSTSSSCWQGGWTRENKAETLSWSCQSSLKTILSAGADGGADRGTRRVVKGNLFLFGVGGRGVCSFDRYTTMSPAFTYFFSLSFFSSFFFPSHISAFSGPKPVYGSYLVVGILRAVRWVVKGNLFLSLVGGRRVCSFNRYTTMSPGVTNIFSCSFPLFFPFVFSSSFCPSPIFCSFSGPKPV